MTIVLPFLVALVGVLVYALSTNAKVAEIGRILFFAGILVTLIKAGAETFSFLKG